jgi:hypothetical protein
LITVTDSATSDTTTAQTSSNSAFVSFGKTQVITDVTTNTYQATQNIQTTNYSTLTNFNVQKSTTTQTDPLSQSFVIPTNNKNGVFVTSVDLYFAQKVAGELLRQCLSLAYQLCASPVAALFSLPKKRT